jgi:hypothetical protein
VHDAFKKRSVTALLNLFFSHLIREMSGATVSVLGNTVARPPAKQSRRVEFPQANAQRRETIAVSTLVEAGLQGLPFLIRRLQSFILHLDVLNLSFAIGLQKALCFFCT